MVTDAVFWWGDDILHPLIVVRQMLQSVTDPVLDDEQLEES